MVPTSSNLPPLQTLRAFVEVAATGSFTRAADKVALTQTAVSHQIAQLEAWLGKPLFIRAGRSISLTAAGEALLPQVQEHLHALREALDQARSSGDQRRLTVSTTPEFGTQWLTPRIERFLSANSSISLSVTLEYRRADLLRGEADAAIWLGSGPPGLSAERLTLEEEFAVSSPQLQKRLPKRQALLAAPLLRYDGGRHTVLDWQRWHSQIYGGDTDLAVEIDFDSGPIFDTFPKMLEACRCGDGFALVRTSLVADDLAEGRLVKCFIETAPSDLHYHLVTTLTARHRPEVMAFRRWMLDEMNVTAT
jgi:LysR family glycine cleavage system transcriptional activator